LNNFEKIKAMDIEEMAEFLPKICADIPCEDALCDDNVCKKHLIKWLQQESEE
jgi:hypothetical protein